jgi:hypothetical protein
LAAHTAVGTQNRWRDQAPPSCPPETAGSRILVGFHVKHENDGAVLQQWLFHVKRFGFEINPVETNQNGSFAVSRETWGRGTSEQGAFSR